MTQAFRQPASRSRPGLGISFRAVFVAVCACITEYVFMTTALKADDHTVTLTYTVKRLEKDSVSMDYAVRNGRDHRIYVFNLLYHTDRYGNRTPDPELAYIHPEAGGPALIGKYLIPIPPGMKVESPEMPYLDALQAGQSLSGKIRLEYPLRVVDPYIPPAEHEKRLDAGKVRLRIGFLDPAKAQKGEALIEAAKGAGAGHFQCDYGLGLLYQEIVEQTFNIPSQ